MASKSSGGKHRSAETGRYVTKRYADRHPNMIIKESK
ncbi:hypothetical protein HMPREF1531_00493 [Propionibacterium sp. oral taxon 192 str. F0372]|nr:hypothetical protein HMPREF1531_00493 [Propionibacterium sp. oral taxon 192 str. F0372]